MNGSSIVSIFYESNTVVAKIRKLKHSPYELFSKLNEAAQQMVCICALNTHFIGLLFISVGNIMSIFEAFNDISLMGFFRSFRAMLPLLLVSLLFKFNIVRKVVVAVLILVRKIFTRCFRNRNELSVDRIITVNATELEPSAMENLYPKDASVFLVEDNV
jgi:hypothetical protein